MLLANLKAGTKDQALQKLGDKFQIDKNINNQPYPPGSQYQQPFQVGGQPNQQFNQQQFLLQKQREVAAKMEQLQQQIKLNEEKARLEQERQQLNKEKEDFQHQISKSKNTDERAGLWEWQESMMKRRDEGDEVGVNNEYKVEGSQRRGWNQQKREQIQQQQKMANPFSLDTIPQNKAKAADL